MCVSNVIKLVVLLELLQCTWTMSAHLQSSLNSSLDFNSKSSDLSIELDSVAERSLPDPFEDEYVRQLVQNLWAQDLQNELHTKQRKRQYKRDIYSTSASTIGTTTYRATPTKRTQSTTTSRKTSHTTKKIKNSSTTHKNKVKSSTTPASNSKTTKNPGKPADKLKVSRSVFLKWIFGRFWRIFWLKFTLNPCLPSATRMIKREKHRKCSKEWYKNFLNINSKPSLS